MVPCRSLSKTPVAGDRGRNESVPIWQCEEFGSQEQGETEDNMPRRAGEKWHGHEDYGLLQKLDTCDSPRSSSPINDDPFASCSRSDRRKFRRVGKKTSVEQRNKSSDFINLLPDACLHEIFGSLSEGRDRRACASVCRRWLFLQSQMPFSSLKSDATLRSTSVSKDEPSFKARDTRLDVRDGEISRQEREGWEDSQYEREDDGGKQPPRWAIGYLSRNLDGRKATDVRLASIAVGTAARGGLGELAIKECAGVNVPAGVSDVGLTAIGTCCGALRSLRLWNCSRVRDEGLCAIGKGCRLLEKIHLSRCAGIGDSAVLAVAKGCPLLTSVTLDSCGRIGDAGLKAIGRLCAGLLSFSVINCDIGSEGVEAIVLGCRKVKKMKLEKIGINDMGLAFVGQHCTSLVKLKLSGLKKVSEVGFLSFGRNCSSLPELRALCISACQGLSEGALEAVGKSCRDLKFFSLSHCEALSDIGLYALTEFCFSLECLHLEGCNRLTHAGLKAALTNRRGLKTLRLSKCNGVCDQGVKSSHSEITCNALKSLSLSYCPGVGNICLEMVGHSCLSLEELDLSGLTALSDGGLKAFVRGMGSKLQRLNLSGCVIVSDQGVSAVAQHFKGNLESLNLEGCVNVTDETLKIIAVECHALEELDLSMCEITDEGILTVVASIGSRLKNLSLAGCKLVTDRCLPVIGDACWGLWALNLKQCCGLSPKALDFFESHYYKVHLWRS